MDKSNYILACDERGTTRWPSLSRTWAYGGVIVKDTNLIDLIGVWNNIKLKLCGSKDVELKWNCFFDGKHQEKIINPLKSIDPQAWRDQVLWAIDKIFSVNEVLPIGTYIRKNEASDVLFLHKPSGNKVVDIDVIWVGVLAQFALFLSETNSTGQVWLDNLGSSKEQMRRQASWEALRRVGYSGVPRNPYILEAIDPTLIFLDSKKAGLIQIADFVSGIIWAASEGDDEFLELNLEKYMHYGKRTYRLCKVF